MAGGCPVAVAQWQSTGSSNQVSWVQLPVAAGLFSLLYFRLITSKFLYRVSVFIAYKLLPQTLHWLMLTEFLSIFFVGSILNAMFHLKNGTFVCSERIRLLGEKCMLLIVCNEPFCRIRETFT